jgi:hypothetical protein
MNKDIVVWHKDQSYTSKDVLHGEIEFKPENNWKELVADKRFEKIRIHWGVWWMNW